MKRAELPRLQTRRYSPWRLAILIAGLAASAYGDPGTDATANAVTLERIMADPDWIGNSPERPYWSDDSATVLFDRKRQGQPLRDLWRIQRRGGEPELVEDAELGAVDTSAGVLSPDRSHKVYSRNGDIFVKDLAGGALHQLTRTTAREHSPFFLADGEHIGYSRNDLIFVRNLENSLELEPVELRTEDDPAEEDPDDDPLAEAERRLFEIVREWHDEEALNRDRERTLRRADPTRIPPPVYLGEKIEIDSRHLSPAGDWMLLVTSSPKRERGRRDQMANYLSKDGYADVRETRAKVGTAEPQDHKLILVDLVAGSHRSLDLAGLEGIADDPLAAIKAATEAARRAAENDSADDGEKDTDRSKAPPTEPDEPETEAKKEPRPVGIEGVSWTADGRRVAIQIHSYDNKDRWLAIVEREGEPRGIHRLSDPDGWINWSHNDFGWLRDGRRLWFLSEESGFSQLYLHDLESGATKRLTSGDFVTADVELDPGEAFFYFTANVEHPGTYDTYRLPVAGGRLTRVTRLGGITRSQLSPDGRWLLSTHSTTTRPPELFVQPAEPGAEARQLTHTVSDTFKAVAWTAPEIVGVASQNVKRPIWSRLYRPGDSTDLGGSSLRGADGRRPAVVFVHGAGYLQNAHSGWSSYFREFMFHTLLTRRGYVVLDMDYRASRGYGRDWRTAIYRQMGHPEVEDLADGVAYLTAEHAVDPARIGVYGGSYGGFLTFMAMFRRPELFAAGAALRPVTDWAHYNHPYTSNILNTPEVDPEAYRKSSPIEFAEGLEKPLLICGGMLDDNVFFQDTVRLVQRLIELEKTGFETAFYPIEPHGFEQPASWLDEYRRIFALFERHLAP